MAARCAEAQMLFRSGTPFLVEGETGTGKSALIAALAGSAPMLKVDCATMGETASNIDALRRVLSQVRALSLLPEAAQDAATVLLDNIGEMPLDAQAEVRRYLHEVESDGQGGAGAQPRIVALSRQPLLEAVAKGVCAMISTI